MKKIVLILFSTLLLSCSDKEPNSETKSQIIAVADSIASASKNENVAGLMKHLTKDVSIQIRSADEDPQRYTHKSYKKYLTKVFSLISNYQGRRSNERFESLSSGDYVYKFSLTEQYECNNQDLVEVYNQVWHLKKVNNTYKAYKIIINP